MTATVEHIPAEHVGADPGRRARALDDFARGRPVVLVAATQGATDAYLVFSAELATPATVAFAVRHSSGFVCVALPARECDRLCLPPMYPMNHGAPQMSYTVTVDAIAGVGTGISARDRARTITALASPDTVPDDLARPGHVVPCSVPDADAPEPGVAGAALDLARAAGLRPAAAFCALVSETHPGRLPDGPELREFATRHGLVAVPVYGG